MTEKHSLASTSKGFRSNGTKSPCNSEVITSAPGKPKSRQQFLATKSCDIDTAMARSQRVVNRPANPPGVFLGSNQRRTVADPETQHHGERLRSRRSSSVVSVTNCSPGVLLEVVPIGIRPGQTAALPVPIKTARTAATGTRRRGTLGCNGQKQDELLDSPPTRRASPSG